MSAPELLPSHLDPRLEQVECNAKAGRYLGKIAFLLHDWSESTLAR
jgi:hypothetical protein